MSELDSLLELVRKFHGITTYPSLNENNDKLHAGCCELEAAGKLVRRTEVVTWMVVDDV